MMSMYYVDPADPSSYTGGYYAPARISWSIVSGKLRVTVTVVSSLAEILYDPYEVNAVLPVF